jgi:hypothetical protein
VIPTDAGDYMDDLATPQTFADSTPGNDPRDSSIRFNLLTGSVGGKGVGLKGTNDGKTDTV